MPETTETSSIVETIHAPIIDGKTIVDSPPKRNHMPAGIRVPVNNITDLINRTRGQDELHEDITFPLANVHVFKMLKAPFQKNLGDSWTLEIGRNLIVDVNTSPSGEVEWEQHYNPRGNTQRTPGKELEDSAAYAYELLSLIEWDKKRDNKSDPPSSSSGTIIGLSNKTMNDFRKKLLGPDIYRVNAESEDNGQHWLYSLDYKKLLEDTPKLQRIQALANRYYNQNVKKV